VSGATLASVESSDPTVVTFDPPSASKVTFTTHAAGVAEAILRDASGAELGRAAVEVRAASGISDIGAWFVGSNMFVYVSQMSGADLLYGDKSVTMSLNGPFQIMSNSANLIEAHATARGDGQLTATYSDATFVTPVTARVATDVSRIDISPVALSVGKLQVQPYAESVQIHGTGAGCTWSAPSGITITPVTGGLDFGYSLIYQASGASGHYQATCTIGTAQGSIAFDL
jgi:hypothetical protein